MSKIFRGLSAAPGIGIGKICIHQSTRPLVEDITPDESFDPVREWQVFLDAHRLVDRELDFLSQNANSVVAEVFAAHRLILHDSTLVDAVQQIIFDYGNNAVTATQRAIADLADLFRSFEDEYFAGRSTDIEDLGQRLLTRLGAHINRSSLANLPEETILIAEDLTPSDLAQLSTVKVLGIALARCTPTAHSAILARSLGIPLACTLGREILHLPPGIQAVVDGDRGDLVVTLEEAEIGRYVQLREERQHIYLQAQQLAMAPAITRDGNLIPVRANANSPEDVERSPSVGADGVGLLRTEYLFRERSTAPAHDEQSAVYEKFIAQVTDQLTVRALDAGGDKPVQYITHGREQNPFLGLRGVRLLIEQPEILRTQYASLQSAVRTCASSVQVRFMLPMISTVEEVRTIRELLADLVATEPHLDLGIMIEVPSAALTARALAPYVDFLSIGTNDLAQYALASDRTNSTVARLADPLHPAVLHLIKLTCDAGHSAGKPVALCGEIGGDVLAVPLLLGLGVNELSVPIPAIPSVKQTIRLWDLPACRLLAERALICHDAADVRRLLSDASIAP